MRTTKNTAGPLARMNVEVTVLLDQNAAVAHAAFRSISPLSIDEATGSVKREPGDTRDDGIAVNLAVGRALVKLGRKLQETGRSQVQESMSMRSAADAARMVRREPHGRHARTGDQARTDHKG